MKAHPDKGGSEAKMAAVNEAYEVLSKPGKHTHSLLAFTLSFLSPYSCSFLFSLAYLSTPQPELRQRYDNGDDPNDPTAQQGGNPFQGGFPGGQFAQFFQQAGFGGSGGFQFHYSPPGFH